MSTWAASYAFFRQSQRNCPKSLGRPYNVALRDTEMVLFGPFWRSILAKSTVETPLRPLFGQFLRNYLINS